MLMSTIALLLAMTANAAEPVDDAREAYTKCMVRAHNDAVDAQVTVSAFRRSAETICETERLEYHKLVIKSEQEFGSSAAEAKKYADEEVKVIIDSIKTDFAQNRDDNAKLIID